MHPPSRLLPLALALLPWVAAVPSGPAAPAPARPGAQATPPPRPIVLLVHGRGMQGQDTAILRREWLDALRRGLGAAGAPGLLRDGDLRLVWYADALDPMVPAACPRGGGWTPRTPGPGSDLADLFHATGALLALVSAWQGEPSGAPLRQISGDLLYFGDRDKRCAAEERLAGALADAAAAGRPVVLVSHSFGALVAYSHLGSRRVDGSRHSTAPGTPSPGPPAPPIPRWVTIGSLLGHPELRQLLGGERVERGLPPGVASWVNVRDPADPLSARLLGFGTAAADGVAVSDVTTRSPAAGDPHNAGRYLADPATGRAVLEGWCAALGAEAPRETACRALAG